MAVSPPKTSITAEDQAASGSPWCHAIRHAIDWLRQHESSGFSHDPVDDAESLVQWLHDHRTDDPSLVRLV